MKINEILTEAPINPIGKIGTVIGKTVGGTAKAVGAVAGGVAGIPGAIKRGYQAGKATVSGEPTQPAAQGGVVQQAPGFRGGPIQPRTGAQQYTQDIASAIRTGASGGYHTQGATPTAYGRAPAGTQVGQWTKTYDGWVNTTNNKAATPKEAETLDRKWYNETQKQLRQPGTRPQAVPAGQPAQAGQTAKAHTGGKVAGQLSQTPNAIRLRQARAAKRAPAPVQPAATPTATVTPAAQPSMSQLLKQRQAQGLGAYESVDFSDLKAKLQEALDK